MLQPLVRSTVQADPVQSNPKATTREDRLPSLLGPGGKLYTSAMQRQ